LLGICLTKYKSNKKDKSGLYCLYIGWTWITQEETHPYYSMVTTWPSHLVIDTAGIEQGW